MYHNRMGMYHDDTMGKYHHMGLPLPMHLTMLGDNSTVKKIGIAGIAFTGIVAAVTIGGVFQAFSDGYFLGRARKKGVTYKNIARRNAAMGGVIGSVVAFSILASPDKTN